MGDTPIATRVLGQDAIPGIPQNINLEHAIVVSPKKIVAAAREVLAIELQPAAAASAKARAPKVSEAPRTRVLWTPNRAFVG